MLVPALMAVAALAPIVGDLIGRALAAGDLDEAKRLADDAVKRFDIPLPAIEQMAAQLGESAMGGVRADPELQASQRRALADMERYSREGADNLEFRAAMDAATQATNREANARDAALRQEMQSRGMGNSGAEYALRQQSGQDAVNRLAGQGFDAALAGRRQALQMLESGAGLAGRMEERDLGLQTARARAADDINRFNATQRADAVRDRFAMQHGLATSQANAMGNAANVRTGQAAQTQQQWGNYGQAAGQAAGAAGQHMIDERKRKDERDWLSSLTGGK